jgi:hypothetical protein
MTPIQYAISDKAVIQLLPIPSFIFLLFFNGMCSPGYPNHVRLHGTTKGGATGVILFVKQ